jgi:hypothetical protein
MKATCKVKSILNKEMQTWRRTMIDLREEQENALDSKPLNSESVSSEIGRSDLSYEKDDIGGSICFCGRARNGQSET